ncbi:FNIP repeat-containing protein [Heterostelium album PN500]|uniref:FNIP repeat-containing protein n=1 Tax=Heterostelium pallidum (strain ATCC 26659 / Pp 5 / PN500) TaxID=670386 RepID=D3BLL0_HETP5|nr:FNIP repeat-containing protein [Heterostelium album PN500]EFA77461.1 FNIP repeat-containing protein [Heterostelium album PN500]|eukprot:XP_020429589.1 FNIP repeat-containing protein [Heterostelium album PN500]
MNNIKLTDKLINGKNVLKINLNNFQQYIVLVYNHLKDKENEQHTNITLIGNINQNNNEIVIPDTVDTQYQLIIMHSYRVDFKSICVELLNKSQSYTINFENNLFKKNLDYFKQSHIINNKRYHSISRFPNSNAINDVYLVCGTDDHILINFKDNQKSYERAENEIKAMKLLKGNWRRFVQLVDYHHDKYNQIFHIITGYCGGGDLSQKYKHLTDINQIFPESDIGNYISQLFNILLDLDKQRNVHCDIKPSNIFINESDAYGTLILGDFGCCEFIGESTIIEYPDTKDHILEPLIVISSDSNRNCIYIELSESSICKMYPNTLINATRGTIGYISPEAMNRQYAQSCDIFSIGSTILKLLCCHQDDRNNHQLFQTKREIKISEFRYSKQLIEFIHRLLDQSPKNRESLNQLLNQYIETVTNNQIITFNLNTPFHNTSVNVTEINFGNDFNQILSVGVLPKSLKSLVFGYSFNQILSVVGVLPESLESLEFRDEFNQILSVGVLPESLESLVFGDRFNQILSVGVLPESLESLVFGDRFNQKLSIVGVLPESLESLVFGNRFNQILSVGVLPKSLELLSFGNRFNQILSVDVLPESLKSLVFGDGFNQKLSVDVLPESLKSLSMTNHIDRKDLPQHIENLFIGGQRIDIDSF